MLNFGTHIKNMRHLMGISQHELATLSRLSVPAIQKIESGNSNPTLSSMKSIAGVLGLHLSVDSKSLDIKELADLGVPLQGASSRKIADTDHWLLKTKRALLQLSIQSNTEERVLDAVQGFVFALKDHFPAIFSKLSKSEGVKKFLERPITGRIIKLRRIAITNLAERLRWAE